MAFLNLGHLISSWGSHQMCQTAAAISAKIQLCLEESVMVKPDLMLSLELCACN